MSNGSGRNEGDTLLPASRPVDLPILLNHLHDATRRLEAAYFNVVGTERAYEKLRGEVIEQYLATESMSAAEKYARISPELQNLAHRKNDAQMNLRRWEAIVAHWQFLVAHAPSQ